MFSLLFSIAYRAWKLIIWIFTQIARLVILFLNTIMFPQNKTGLPNLKAILVWGAANAVAFFWSAHIVQAQTQTQTYTSFGLASLHFLIIVSAFLVISEENDIWSGYVRYDRVTLSTTTKEPKDYRSFKRGKIVKSFPLIVISAVAYLAFLAGALKGLHSTSDIFTIRYRSSNPIWQYLFTVSAQIPIVDTFIKWTDFKLLMEFHGVTGTAIKLALHITNITIIVGIFSSYFRQKNQIRQLIEGLASAKGDIPFLQLQAQRAPDEIKSSIIKMAVEHPEAHTRRRAMAVAPYLNILTFPHTMVHHLHNERVEQNKRRALAVSIEIVRNNVSRFEPAFIRLLRSKIDFQLKKNRQHHSQRVIGSLMELRGLLPSDRPIKSVR